MSLKFVLLFALVFVICVSAQEELGAEAQSSASGATATASASGDQQPVFQLPIGGLDNLVRAIGLQSLFEMIRTPLNPVMNTVTGFIGNPNANGK